VQPVCNPADPYSLDEFEVLAEKLMSPAVRTLVQGGSGAGAAIRGNRAAWGEWFVNPRALVDVSRLDLSTNVLGERIALPVLIAPSGLHGLLHPDAESATARAARQADTIMVLSSGSGRTIEELVPERARHWMQLYWGKDRAFLKDLVQLAAEAGFRAIALTTDMPVRPWTHRDMRAALNEVGDVKSAYLAPRSLHLQSGADWQHDPRLTWRDLDWLRSISRLPIVLKGVMTAEDARLAVQHGAAAIIVSNHGGRTLEAAPPTAKVLPDIAAAVEGRIEVLVDGGVRSGADILKALALGARAVLIGRPVSWGLAVAGAEGVARVLAILRGELECAMAMAGFDSPMRVTRSALLRRS
jgi:4-hydroxymandelate oxidase